MGPTESGEMAIWLPLAVGAGGMLATITIHALAVTATVTFVRRERRLGHSGASFLVDVIIVTVAIHIVLVAHLLEIGVWATLFMFWGNSEHSPPPTTTRPSTTRPWVTAT